MQQFFHNTKNCTINAITLQQLCHPMSTPLPHHCNTICKNKNDTITTPFLHHCHNIATPLPTIATPFATPLPHHCHTIATPFATKRTTFVEQKHFFAPSTRLNLNLNHFSFTSLFTFNRSRNGQSQ
jgi:hypothetical protein